MEDELQKARVISDRMFKAHNERDFDLDWHKEKADQLSERWQNIHSQIDSRLVLITSYGICFTTFVCKYYKCKYCSLTLTIKFQASGPGWYQQISETLQRLLQ